MKSCICVLLLLLASPLQARRKEETPHGSESDEREAEAEKYKRVLMRRARESSSWKEIDMLKRHPKEVKGYKLRRHRGISEHDVSMMQLLMKRIHNPNITSKYKADYFAHGRSCTNAEREKQSIEAGQSYLSICDEVTAYKVAHLGFPEASTFIDVGSNKGYTTALMVGLWAGNGYGLTPFKLFQHYERLNMFQTGPSPAGYCKTGLDRAYPLYCPSSPSTKDSRHSRNRHADGRCDRQRLDGSPGPHLSVYAVDGGSKLVRSFRNATLSLPVFNTSVLSRSIHFVHAAMSDREGVATFSVPDDVSMSGYEGGKINSVIRKNGRVGGLEVVNMTTLDKFINSSMLFGKVDVVKVDAEGMDLSVIRGGQKSLSSLGIIMWEQESFASLNKIFQLLEKNHFECFAPLKKSFLKLSSGCINLSSIVNKGNIVCASRLNAPIATMAFDLLSEFQSVDDLS